MRLDRYLVGACPDVSRSGLQQLIQTGSILVNQQPIRKSTLLKNGDKIQVNWPDNDTPVTPDPNIKLSVIYEDSDVLVIDKPADLVVHPGAGNATGTLVNGLLHYDYACFSLMLDPDSRPGIVHRLDKNTTGAMVIAKNEDARGYLIEAFKNGRVEKNYLALVDGVPPQERGVIQSRIGRHHANRKKMAVVAAPAGKDALTTYRMVESSGTQSLLQVEIQTGRTHQIRVHLAHIGYPVMGDSKYGRSRRAIEVPKRQMLHAWKLSFPPRSGGVTRTFTAPVPKDFAETAARIGIGLEECLNRPLDSP